MRHSVFCRLIFVSTFFVYGSVAHADDWPQWLGPKRDSVWREKGIVGPVGKDELKTQWRAPVGFGFSSPSVVDGVVYVSDFVPDRKEDSDNPGTRAKMDGQERIQAFDAKTGKLIWTHSYPEKYSISYSSGPRAAPTVINGQVFMLGAMGKLTALDAKKGSVLWSKDLPKDYDAKTPQWGYATHPLVDGDRLYVGAGGDGSTLVALDKNSGKEVWRALSASEPGYGPPTIIEHNGKKQLLFWHAKDLNSLDPETGKKNWSVAIAPDHGMSIAPPRKEGDLLFIAGAPKQSVVLRLTDKEPQVLWRGKSRDGIYPANSAPFVEKGTVYGVDALSGSLRAQRLLDGEGLWDTSEPTTGERRGPYGTAFLVKHEESGNFHLFNENGELIIARLDDKGYQELGRQRLIEPTSVAFGRKVAWSHPAFADKAIFARNDREIVRVDMDKKSYPQAAGPAIPPPKASNKPAEPVANLEEAGKSGLVMLKHGMVAWFDLMQDPKLAKQFTKNDLWTKVDTLSVTREAFPAISYLYSFFPESYAKAHKKGNVSNSEWGKSEDFLDHIDQELTKREEEYRKLAVAAKKVPVPEKFRPTKAQWYKPSTDKDADLWRVFSEVSALEYLFYRMVGADIDLAQKYPNETSVRVRDPKSKKTLEEYFAKSKNPKRAIEIARRLAKLQKEHMDRYDAYPAGRDLLVRFLTYHWEFHDLLLPENKPAAPGAAPLASTDPSTHK